MSTPNVHVDVSRFQPQEHRVILARPCDVMRGGLSCCRSSRCSARLGFTLRCVPSRARIMSGDHIFLLFTRLSLTLIIDGGRFPPALLILVFPLGFRVTCYYYRKAYYRAFFLDPPACAVGEPGKRRYRGETRFPFILQNLHRYFYTQDSSSSSFCGVTHSVVGSVINRWICAFAKAPEAAPALLYALRLWAAVCPRSLRCVLARARQSLLGRHLSGDCVPAPARSFVAQGLVPDDWHRGRRHNDCGADRVLSAGAHCLSGDSCLLVRFLRFRRHAAPQTSHPYSAALAGYTAAIIAADNLGATGRAASSDVFLLAVTRASEICIGIACAGIVLAGTDPRRRPAPARSIICRSCGRDHGSLWAACSPLQRRNCRTRKPNAASSFGASIALDPPSLIRCSGNPATCATTRQSCKRPFTACSERWNGWRGVATHLGRWSGAARRQGAHIIRRSLPSELRSVLEADSPVLWIANPLALRRVCKEAVRTLIVPARRHAIAAVAR